MTASDSFVGAGLRDSPYAELRKENKMLQVALGKYGEHMQGCGKWRYGRSIAAWAIDPTRPCTCGLSALLQAICDD